MRVFIRERKEQACHLHYNLFDVDDRKTKLLQCRATGNPAPLRKINLRRNSAQRNYSPELIGKDKEVLHFIMNELRKKILISLKRKR